MELLSQSSDRFSHDATYRKQVVLTACQLRRYRRWRSDCYQALSALVTAHNNGFVEIQKPGTISRPILDLLPPDAAHLARVGANLPGAKLGMDYWLQRSLIKIEKRIRQSGLSGSLSHKINLVAPTAQKRSKDTYNKQVMGRKSQLRQ